MKEELLELVPAGLSPLCFSFSLFSFFLFFYPLSLSSSTAAMGSSVTLSSFLILSFPFLFSSSLFVVPHDHFFLQFLGGLSSSPIFFFLFTSSLFVALMITFSFYLPVVSHVHPSFYSFGCATCMKTFSPCTIGSRAFLEHLLPMHHRFTRFSFFGRRFIYLFYFLSFHASFFVIMQVFFFFSSATSPHLFLVYPHISLFLSQSMVPGNHRLPNLSSYGVSCDLEPIAVRPFLSTLSPCTPFPPRYRRPPFPNPIAVPSTLSRCTPFLTLLRCAPFLNPSPCFSLDLTQHPHSFSFTSFCSYTTNYSRDLPQPRHHTAATALSSIIPLSTKNQAAATRYLTTPLPVLHPSPSLCSPANNPSSSPHLTTLTSS
ncbi:uncharacterized protein LOC110007701 [Amborella trichopoda]|uniref:uncharacterized protein LOC110007701 n=1 Tax=Amborella trichopoda TaxID=13333 RepID=UPI0009C06650|nr:uncharacterized protein LOC110007701 [Amborella trichopoda]|eukprot:XP_020525923.1 uncharacterized protein LOC110007701 [Amborella trichopoda]